MVTEKNEAHSTCWRPRDIPGGVGILCAAAKQFPRAGLQEGALECFTARCAAELLIGGTTAYHERGVPACSGA